MSTLTMSEITDSGLAWRRARADRAQALVGGRRSGRLTVPQIRRAAQLLAGGLSDRSVAIVLSLDSGRRVTPSQVIYARRVLLPAMPELSGERAARTERG